MDGFHYIFWLLNKIKNEWLAFIHVCKIISCNDVCLQTQNIVKYLGEFLFSWDINDEQHWKVNVSHYKAYNYISDIGVCA